jgi:hypothetical protein
MTVELREKSDRYVYTRLGEKINTESVHSYLGKKIPMCYITDAGSDVIAVPADLNKDNFLPSNMVYLSQRFLQGDPLTAVQNFTTIRKTMGSGELVEVVLLCPQFVLKKAQVHAKELLDKYEDLKGLEHSADTVYALFDKLMYDGLKGLYELKITKDDVTYSVDQSLAMSYLSFRTKQRMSAVAGLQLK